VTGSWGVKIRGVGMGGFERHGVILKVQLSKKAGLTNKKGCLAFHKLHPWGIIV